MHEVLVIFWRHDTIIMHLKQPWCSSCTHFPRYRIDFLICWVKKLMASYSTIIIIIIRNIHREQPKKSSTWTTRSFNLYMICTLAPWWRLFPEHPWVCPAVHRTSSYDSWACPGRREASLVSPPWPPASTAHSWMRWGTFHSPCAGKGGGWGCMLHYCSLDSPSPISWKNTRSK